MEKNIYRDMRKLEDTHWWFLGRRKILERVILRLELPRECRILDCGCGTGGNLCLLASFGRVTGVEADYDAVCIARSRNICEIFEGWLPDGINFFPIESFDLVTLLDVLEHVDDDEAALKSVRSVLAPGGFLIVTVPAFKFLWSEHDEEHHHKRRYRGSELEHVILRAGFNLLYMTYFNFWLFPMVSCVRLGKKLSGNRRRKTDLWLPHPKINKVLYYILSSERFLIEKKLKLPFGVSLLAVASKK
jgi:SAM-dependent methyltransferase